MRTLALPLAAILAFSATAQDLPQPSPLGKVEQVVGLTNVSIEYSRPSKKGRVIFGELVPYGEVWRTGANKATKFTCDGVVTIGGEKLGPGSYSIFTIPREDAWEVIFNKNTELWGESDRKQEEDVLRVKSPKTKIEEVETFTIEVGNLKGDMADLVLRWEYTECRIPMEAPSTDQGIANIKEALAKPDVTFGGYNSSARFALDRKVMTKETLEWAEKSVTMEERYYNTHTLARAQAANGLNKEAIATAEKSMKLAQEAKSESYIKMNRDLIQECKSAGK